MQPQKITCGVYSAHSYMGHHASIEGRDMYKALYFCNDLMYSLGKNDGYEVLNANGLRTTDEDTRLTKMVKNVNTIKCSLLIGCEFLTDNSINNDVEIALTDMRYSPIWQSICYVKKDDRPQMSDLRCQSVLVQIKNLELETRNLIELICKVSKLQIEQNAIT